MALLFYNDDAINRLLTNYIVEENVSLMDAIDLEQHDGNTVFENLQAREEQLHETNQDIAFPINLGNRHWVGLYIRHQGDRTHPEIHYFDPLGDVMPTPLMGILRRIYRDTPTTEYRISPIRYQYDGYNCGPWVVEFFRHLVRDGSLPPEDFDIQRARQEHGSIPPRE